MKKATFTIAFLLCVVSGFTQSLVSSNKSWNNLRMDYWNPNNLSTENLKFTTDTVINSVSYKKVERSTDQLQQYWSSYGFIREDSIKRVFYKLNATGPENLFYNFSLQLYDTITAYSINTLGNNIYIQPQLYFVVSVDSILIGDTFRKRMNLGSPDDSTYTFESWIDSTGNQGGLLHNNEMLVGRDSYSLLCFSEDGIVKYHHPYIDSCYVLSGLGDKKPAGWSAKISPNPITESSTLTVEHSNSGCNMQADFFDLTGRNVYSKSFTIDLIISRKDFQRGIYFYRISDSSGNTLTGKVIVN